MKLISLAAIEVGGDRQRTEFDDKALSDLAQSIEEIGLLHPPVVKDGRFLVAGERRYRACVLLDLQDKCIRYAGEILPQGMIPVHDLGDVTGLQAYQAELEENIVRVDISWQDRAKAISRMHELRAAIAGEQGKPWTPIDTAAAILPDVESGGQIVRKAVALTRHLDDPDIAKAKNAEQAFKLLQRKEERQRNEVLASIVGRESTSSLHRVINADCREWLLDEAPAGMFDCAVIDPPYGMGAQDFGDGAGRLTGIDHQYEDSWASFTGLMQQVIMGLDRVMKAESHIYIWCDIDGFSFIREAMRQAGWWTHRTPLINIKRNGGRVPWPEHGPRRCYELVLYAVRGKKRVTGIYRDVFESTLSEEVTGHGAQKPVEAYVELLKRSCRPGDHVLDCFGGSGTMLEAAHALKLRSTVVELSPAYYGQCLKRLEALE